MRGKDDEGRRSAEAGPAVGIEKTVVPQPGPGGVLVKMVGAGVCHTDLPAADGDRPIRPSLPFIPGHEGAGVVAVVGAGVTRLREGDPAGIAWLHDACGCCGHCITSWTTPCESQHNSGYSVNGSSAEYAIGSAACVAWLPAVADFAAMAPILCAGVTTCKGIKETEVRAGEWIATSSVDGLGHIAIQYAKAMGLHVAALDVSEDKMALARQLGAEVAVEAAAPDAATQVTKATGGGVHGAQVTAVSPAAFSQGLSLVQRKDTVSLVGLPPGSVATPIFDVVRKRITIRGSIVETREDLAEAIAFAAEGKVNAHIHGRPLGKVNEVVAELKEGREDGCTVLRP